MEKGKIFSLNDVANSLDIFARDVNNLAGDFRTLAQQHHNLSNVSRTSMVTMYFYTDRGKIEVSIPETSQHIIEQLISIAGKYMVDRMGDIRVKINDIKKKDVF